MKFNKKVVDIKSIFLIVQRILNLAGCPFCEKNKALKEVL